MAELINYEGVEKFDLGRYCEEAYLNYALYVIKDRALPYIGDGLKPVQRRIVYTMEIENINTKDKKKKSAYTVGQVLGRFHPHGDQACYEAMIRLVQNFNIRYPLIGGQGNFGDLLNPDSYAAMRYTESYLEKYSQSLLSELNSGNVDWQPNYNNDEKEPVYLPARVPNILLNGAAGIAVAMATDIPPHNLNEIVDACCALIDNPDMSLTELLEIVKGPDYPTKAEITNSPEELYQIYATGRGSIRQRAVWHKEDDKIIITELPYQTTSKLITNIAELIQNKKILTIDDVQDNSSENETQIVIQLKSKRVDEQQLMNQLFVLVELEKTLTVNMNMIGLNGKPQVKGLKEILLEWLEFRRDIVRKRFLHRLAKLRAELMKIRGYLIAFKNLDEVIRIVREEPKPKEVLMERLGLTSDQATSILELRIKNLARLEEDALIKQEQQLIKEEKTIEILLKNKKKFDLQIQRELLKAKEEFGSERNTPIVHRPAAKAEVIEEKIPEEPVTIVLSKNGFIRCGKGHEFEMDKLQYRANDEYATHILGWTHKPIYIIDNQGKSYTIMPTLLPNMRGFGEPITKFIHPDDGSKILGIYSGEPTQHLIVASNRSYGFICKLEDLDTKNKKGKKFFNLKDESTLLLPILLSEDFNPEQEFVAEQLTLISREGRVLTFDVNQMVVRNKGTGNKLMDINKGKFEQGEDYVQFMLLTKNGDSLEIINGNRKMSVDTNRLQATKSSPGNKGQPIIKGINSNSKVRIAPKKSKS